MLNKIFKYFNLYFNTEQFRVGGHCGICGKWIPDKIFNKYNTWGVCEKCETNSIDMWNL